MPEIIISKKNALPGTNLRQSGVEAVGAIPWGSHFCQFCQTKEDLLETLVPYFKEGLANNEFCVWVTCEFLTESDARHSLEEKIPDFAEFEKKGQIEIFPYYEWYLEGGKFEMERVLNSWLDKYESGLAKGFCGLRVSGNPFWLKTKQDWRDFGEYESNISGAIAGKNILVLCAYPLQKYGASEIIDVVNNHEFALIKRGGVLETIESAARRKLREDEEQYRRLFNSMTEGFALGEIVLGPDGNPCDYRFIEVNPAFEKFIGFERSKIIGKLRSQIPVVLNQSSFEAYAKTALTSKPQHFESYNETLKKYYSVRVYSSSPGRFAAIFTDITERRQAEELFKISELKYRRLFESAKDGILILDFGTGKIVDVNPFLINLLGYSYSEMLEKYPWDIGFFKDIVPSKNAFAELQIKESIRYENLPLETKDGKKMFVEFVSNVYMVNGKKVIQCNVRDITDRRQVEEELRKTNQRLAIISYSANRLLTSENPKQVVQNMCQRVMEFLDCQVFFNFLLDDEKKCLHLNASAGTSPETAGSIEWLNLGDDVCGCVARDGNQIVCDHVQETKEIKTKLVKSLGVRAYACHPLLNQDRVVGTLSFGAKNRDTFSKEDLALMRAVTDQVAIAMIRVRSQETLRETKDYLENLLDSANAPMIVWNPDFTIARFNHAFERLTQYSSSDAIGKNLEILFPENSRSASLDKIKLTLVGEQWKVVEIPIQRRDGDIRIALWNSANVYGEDGKTLLATIAQGQDITEIKRTEESLRESEEKFRQIADAMPNLVWTARPNGNVEYVNLTFRSYTGIPKVNGVIWNAIPLNANDRRVMELTRKRAAGLERPYQLEQRIRRSDGNWRWHLTRCVPIFKDGQITKWYGTATDIDDIKLAAEKLRDADQEKSKFISTMSHELRNPLTPIVTGIELVKSYLDQDPQDASQNPASDKIIRESVAIIDQQAKTMARLLDDMLDISRISRGKVQLKKQPVSLRDNLARAIETVSPLIRSQNHQFSAVLPDASLRVLADPVRLQQIFINLLNNAVKYTPPGGRIWLETSQIGNFSQIAIRDTGLGIEPERIKSIFMSYGNSRGVTPFVSTQGELGIGLKLTKDLVSLHGGTITASSAGKDKGCEFTIRLRTLLPGDEFVDDATPDLGAQEKAANGLRALVIDDNASAADMIARALNFFGHNTKVCYNAQEVLEIAKTYQPHIMFIDIEMPGMNGYDLAKALRKMENQSLEPVKLVAVTGYGQKEDKERALAAGFDLHLSKPVEMQSLRKAIDDLVPNINGTSATLI